MEAVLSKVTKVVTNYPHQGRIRYLLSFDRKVRTAGEGERISQLEAKADRCSREDVRAETLFLSSHIRKLDRLHREHHRLLVCFRIDLHGRLLRDRACQWQTGTLISYKDNIFQGCTKATWRSKYYDCTTNVGNDEFCSFNGEVNMPEPANCNCRRFE